MRNWLIGGGIAICTLTGGAFYVTHHTSPTVTAATPTTVVVKPGGPDLLEREAAAYKKDIGNMEDQLKAAGAE